MSEIERKEFIEFIEQYSNELSKSKEKSREFLINAGIYTPDGQLSSNYSNLCIP